MEASGLFADMPFLSPIYHEVPRIDEKTRCYQFEKHTFSVFIAPNPNFYRPTLYTDWSITGHMTLEMSYPIILL